MTAISPALPMLSRSVPQDDAGSQPPPSAPRDSNGAPSAFSNMLSSAGRRDHEDAGAAKAPSRKDDQEHENPAATAAVTAPAQPRVVLPLTLLDGVDPNGQQITDHDKPSATGPQLSAAEPGEIELKTPAVPQLAFAARLVETTASTADSPTQTSGLAKDASTRLQPAPAKSAPETAAPKVSAPHAEAVKPVAPAPPAHDTELHPQVSTPTPQASHANTIAPGSFSVPEPAPAAPPAPAAQAPAPARIIEPSHLEGIDAAQNPSAKDISLHVAAPDRTSASIRIVESNSELRVAIHASDTQLAETLRGGVDQLTSRLNSNGWSAEIWRPAAIPSASAIQSSASEMHQRHGSGQEQATPFPNRDRNNDRQKRPEWVEEFDLCN